MASAAQRRFDVRVRCRRITQRPQDQVHPWERINPGIRTAMPTAIHAHCLLLYFAAFIELPCCYRNAPILLSGCCCDVRIITNEYCSASRSNPCLHELIGSYHTRTRRKRATPRPPAAVCTPASTTGITLKALLSSVSRTIRPKQRRPAKCPYSRPIQTRRRLDRSIITPTRPTPASISIQSLGSGTAAA